MSYKYNRNEVIITEIDVQHYIDERLDNQIKWYSRKSTTAQRRYLTLKTIVIVLAALIPVLSGSTILFKEAWSVTVILSIIGVFGAAITVTEGLCRLRKYHEMWIRYRSTAECLKREKYLFMTKTPPYSDGDDQNRFALLVRKTEKIISEEAVDWTAIWHRNS